MKHLVFIVAAASILLSCTSLDTATPTEPEAPVPETVEIPEDTEDEMQPTAETQAGTESEQADDPQDTPSPEKQPLSQYQIDSFIKERALTGFLPVMKDGNLYGTSYDLYGNRMKDFFILFTENRENGTDFGYLSDISRIYNPDIEPHEFYIQAFLQEPGRMVPGKRVNLGKRVVIGDLTSLPLSKYKRLPFALIIDFINAEKVEQEWIIYGTAGISRFSIIENTSMETIIKDLDDDGMIDIILKEEILEEGVGAETLLTWYRWDGKEMVMYRNSNIVQNIQEFLEICAWDLEAGEWNAFLSHALLWDTLRTLESRGLKSSDIMDMMFSPSPDDFGTPPPISIHQTIEEVVFPEITENPFASLDGIVEFPLSVRIRSGGENYLYTASIILNQNPFRKPQFYFALTS